MKPKETVVSGVKRDELGRVVAGSPPLNPTGRPKTDGHFRELCRKRTVKALKALTAALDDPDSRVAAAKALLEFAWGKAPAAGFISPNDAVQTSARWRPEEGRELLAELRKLRKSQEPDADAEH